MSSKRPAGGMVSFSSRAQAVSLEGLAHRRPARAARRHRFRVVSRLAPVGAGCRVRHHTAAVRGTQDRVRVHARGGPRQRRARRDPHRPGRQLLGRRQTGGHVRAARRGPLRAGERHARSARGERQPRGVGARRFLATAPPARACDRELPGHGGSHAAEDRAPRRDAIPFSGRQRPRGVPRHRRLADDGERGQAHRAELRVGPAGARDSRRADRPALGPPAGHGAHDHRGGRGRQRRLAGNPVGASAAAVPARLDRAQGRVPRGESAGAAPAAPAVATPRRQLPDHQPRPPAPGGGDEAPDRRDDRRPAALGGTARAAAQDEGLRKLRRDPHLPLRRPRHRHAGALRVRPGLHEAVARDGREPRRRGLRRPAHDLRQHRDPRPRAGAPDPLRPPLVHGGQGRRRGGEGPGARAHGGLGARAWRSPPLRGAGPWGVGDADHEATPVAGTSARGRA